MAQNKTNYIGYKVTVEGDTIGFLNVDEEIEFDNAIVVLELDGEKYEGNIELLQSKKLSPLRRRKSTKEVSV